MNNRIMKKKAKQHHHLILGLLKKTEEENEKAYGLNVNRTILRSNLPDELKQQYRDLLRERLSTNRQFFKDIREAKKSMMIQEKLLEERWRLHSESLVKIKESVGSQHSEDEKLEILSKELEKNK